MMTERIEELIKVGPAVWPGKKLEVEPSDMTRFAPLGMGLGAPTVMLPWDDLSTVVSRGNYYGLQPHSSNPLADAPVTEEAGGTIYFDDHPQKSDFEAVMRLMGVYDATRDYAAYVATADNPQDQRFLVQLRIIGPSGLVTLYSIEATDETRKYVQQPIAVGELLWQFLEIQQAQWGSGYSAQLAGTMGGDGDWAKESLAFGFMVENAYHGVYRIWSRAWLVTK